MMKKSVWLSGLAALAMIVGSVVLAAGIEQNRAATSIEKLIEARERESWEAAKRRDLAAYEALCLPELIEISSSGETSNLQDILVQLNSTTILEYRMEDIKVTFPNELTAIIRYRIFARYSSGGNDEPATWCVASAVWIKKGGEWKAALYQETPIEKK